MTEQPVQVRTEQQFLGNAEPLQHYVPNAHRVAPPRLFPPSDLPYDAMRAHALLIDSLKAASKLLKARAAAKQAEDALSEALAVEGLAENDSVNADRELLDFVRKAADQ